MKGIRLCVWRKTSRLGGRLGSRQRERKGSSTAGQTWCRQAVANNIPMQVQRKTHIREIVDTYEDMGPSSLVSPSLIYHTEALLTLASPLSLSCLCIGHTDRDQPCLVDRCLVDPFRRSEDNDGFPMVPPQHGLPIRSSHRPRLPLANLSSLSWLQQYLPFYLAQLWPLIYFSMNNPSSFHVRVILPTVVLSVRRRPLLLRRTTTIHKCKSFQKKTSKDPIDSRLGWNMWWRNA